MARRLAAILAADVVGYSRLMGQDEKGTLDRLKALRRDLVQPKISEHGGRVVKIMGDGLLAEFPSVVEAVESAVDIQQAMHGREPDLPDEQRIALRIGINLGDVMVEGSDLYGDGVNVAARLEALAEPGGICLSGPAFDMVDGKLEAAFESIGDRQVKNIAKPVRVYRWAFTAAQEGPPVRYAEPLPDKPSIAVLPFVNMSGDAEQEYFSDGITEDVITELSRFHSLFVIARNSSFHYKGQSQKTQDVGRKLGVQYVVEGSVRKAGNRVRVTAQLVEAKTGNHLWAERYDRDLEDIFVVQDELVREIVAAIPGQLDVAAINRARRQPVESLSAYDYVLRGEWLINQDYGSREALALFEKAIEIDPQCARAYTRLAAIHAYSVYSHGASVNEAVEMARSLAEKALDIDPADPTIQATVAEAYAITGEHDLSRRHIERAIKLNPNDYVVMYLAGIVLMYLGDHEEALRWLHKISHHDPFSGDSIREHFFDVYYMTRRYEDAIAAFRGWRNPPPHMYSALAAAYAQLSRMDEARSAITQLERTKPDGFDPIQVIRTHIRSCARLEDSNHWLEGYRKAGFKV